MGTAEWGTSRLSTASMVTVKLQIKLRTFCCMLSNKQFNKRRRSSLKSCMACGPSFEKCITVVHENPHEPIASQCELQCIKYK